LFIFSCIQIGFGTDFGKFWRVDDVSEGSVLEIVQSCGSLGGGLRRSRRRLLLLRRGGGGRGSVRRRRRRKSGVF
jgi:hypothetical protein